MSMSMSNEHAQQEHEHAQQEHEHAQQGHEHAQQEHGNVDFFCVCFSKLPTTKQWVRWR